MTARLRKPTTKGHKPCSGVQGGILLSGGSLTRVSIPISSSVTPVTTPSARIWYSESAGASIPTIKGPGPHPGPRLPPSLPVAGGAPRAEEARGVPPNGRHQAEGQVTRSQGLEDGRRGRDEWNT